MTEKKFDPHHCNNEKCPNGKMIEVMAFRGTGYCSDKCRKAKGVDPK